jgi:hypothetical protein
VRVTEGLKKTRIALSFRLDQRMGDANGDSYEAIMSLIANTFFSKLYIVKKTQGSYFHINISSVYSLNLLRNYLKTFLLISSKYCDYED